VGNLIGRGGATLFVTLDFGSATSSPGCYAALATLILDTPGDSEVIATIGTACDPLHGSVSPLTGGFGITESAAGASAWGTFSGNINLNTGRGVIRYSGVAK
jgi:hypothetical protein